MSNMPSLRSQNKIYKGHSLATRLICAALAATMLLGGNMPLVAFGELSQEEQAPQAQSDTASSTSSDWLIFNSLTEPPYSSVRSGYKFSTYNGSNVLIPAADAADSSKLLSKDGELALYLAMGESETVNIIAPDNGAYILSITYKNALDQLMATELELKINGKTPFYELRRVNFESIWVNEGEIVLDRYKNQISSMPTALDIWSTKAIEDSTYRNADPLEIELNRGDNEIELKCTSGEIYISAFTLSAATAAPEYEFNAAEGVEIIELEAEFPARRNASSIRAGSAFDPSLTPYKSNKKVLNYLEDHSFRIAGDYVEYDFTCESAGYYNLGFFYRQGTKNGFPVFADIMIDGEYPSQQMRQVQFAYSPDFKNMSVKDSEGNLQSVYLEEGAHTVRIIINGEPLLRVFEEVEQLLREINGLSLEIVRLTGSTKDKYRDYKISTYIPDIKEILLSWADRLDTMHEDMKQYTGGKKVGHFSSLPICSEQLRSLSEKPDDLPRRLRELSQGTSSVSRYLAQLLQDMGNNDLGIDKLYFYQEEAKLPEKAGFFTVIIEAIKRFFISFTAQDYSISVSDDSAALQVWMARTRQYVEILQNMADTQFTLDNGTKVDISLMPDQGKLTLAYASGDAPDVALSVQYVIPSNLSIRGALVDLKDFPDFQEIAKTIPEGLFIPGIVENGVYSLPETINFWVLFYRRDILEALDIEVPNSIEEVTQILPDLQRRNMNFYYPTAGMIGTKVFPGTMPLIYQSGGSFYGETIGRTTLDSEASLKGFATLTELFTIYNCPYEVPSFYQQFRDGTLPIGIADYGIYNLLLNAAPEIAGMWELALFPGVTDENGEVQRWTSGGAESSIIFKSTAQQDDAWEFLKWWMSADVQAEFGHTLQTTYGNEYMWNTANTKAFSQLAWDPQHKQAILAQTEWMTEAPWVPATYMLERELSNAYNAVVLDGVGIRRAMDTAVKRINRETDRKLEEFGYTKDGKVVRIYPTPTPSIIWNKED